MSGIQEFVLIVGMMVVTFGVRYPVLALASKIAIPDMLEQALKFVPVAVLTAISVPIMLRPEGSWLVNLDNAHLIAGIFSVFVALLRQHILFTIALGMLMFIVLQLY